MYSAQQSGADNATINPAALNSPGLSLPPQRNLKRNHSPDLYDTPQPGNDGDSKPLRKRGRPMKARSSGSISEAPGQAQASTLPQAIPPPQTPQSQNTTLPQASPAYTPAQTQMPPKTTPTKSTLKALPTVRDHTTDQLNATGDEYLPREIDEFGEKKVQPNGTLNGGREYKCRTFLVPNRGDKLFMLATECARVLGYRDSYLLFNKNRSLFKIIASQAEKDDLVQQEILPFSYRSRQIAIVTARSMFRQFGSRVIVNGRRVRDDYWETKARKQGFTEADLAGEKRPGATKAREAAEAQNNVLLAGQHPEIVYSNNPGPFPGPPQPHLVQPGMIGPPPGTTTRMPGLTLGSELSDSRPRDYSGILKGGPRQEITGPAYQDQTRPSPLGELNAQAHHAADFNRSVNQQRDMRNDYLQGIWRRPHEQPASNLTQQPVASTDTTSVATSRPSHSPHTTATAISQQPGMVSTQSPQMMMTTAPYSQSISAQSNLTQAPMRGMAHSPTQSNTRPTPVLPGSTSSMSQGTPSYNYQSGQGMWPQTPQTPQHNYGSYTAQSQAPHPSQSPASHLRQSSSGQMPANMQFPGMAGMQYGAGQSMYPTDQTPRQYMPQGGAAGPAVTQGWSGQHSPAQQWWTPGQQQ
ncbi:nuclear localization NPL6 [Fusarium albosuccineum]|uniref:Nuclear localization NPL6 n=1 Tax=Fusarium albosuccineum TaxID=1237068 RepID=A0A8H4PDU5_9HYPO|nr:nuclear localization NPL6 [Fusarium albosuccineum]